MNVTPGCALRLQTVQQQDGQHRFLPVICGLAPPPQALDAIQDAKHVNNTSDRLPQIGK